MRSLKFLHCCQRKETYHHILIIKFRDFDDQKAESKPLINFPTLDHFCVILDVVNSMYFFSFNLIRRPVILPIIS